MADSLQSTTPVSASGGFAGRAAEQRSERKAAPPRTDSARATDTVRVDGSIAIARRLLRERVLARTRLALQLGDSDVVPEFAEAIDAESVGAFLGRLMSAQNQLAARRVTGWAAARVRSCLDQVLRDGAEEALELLAADAEAVVVVVEVLAEYERRLAKLATDSPPSC